MMIRTPDIDELIEFPLEFVAVIRNVTSEISKVAVAFDYRPVFVIAELRRSEPFRTVFGIRESLSAQEVQCLNDLIPLAKRFLAEKRIEADAKLTELVLYPLQ
jgi:hypothetical protein